MAKRYRIMNGIDVPLPTAESLPDLLRDCAHWITWKAEFTQDGKKINKIPCDYAGETSSMGKDHLSFDEARSNAEKLRALNKNSRFSVGLAFVENMGFVGLDLDAAIDDDGMRAEHLTWLVDDHPTWGEVSISGRGGHLFYAGKHDRKDIVLIDGRKIEIFGSVGFIAITGKVIPGSTMALSGFASVFEQLKPYIKAKPHLNGKVQPGTFTRPYAISAWGLEGLTAQCDRVRSATEGTNLYHTLVSAACSVGRLVPHAVPWEAAEQALYDATAAAGGRDMNKALRAIREQLEFGSTSPAYPQEREADPLVDLSRFCIGEEEPACEPAPAVFDPGPFPEHLLKVPGLLGQVADYTNRNSFVFQPILALAGALALMSVITGRKVKDRDGVRTNLYLLSVAPSGEGKDMARKTNKRILFAAGANHLVGPESWASGSGLFKTVQVQPAILFQNDEIGRFLQTTNDPKRAPHLFASISILLKLYSSADDVFLGDAYADGRQVTIQQPHAVLFGTTVPGALYSGLTEDSITSGLLSRTLTFEAPLAQQPLQKPESCDPPAEVVEMVRKWAQWQPGSGNLVSVNPTPLVVPTEPAADAVFDDLRLFCRDQRATSGDLLGSLWVRAVENARKLALLYACSESFGDSARVTDTAARWASELAVYLVRRQCWQASMHVGKNSVETESLAMERLVRGSGNNGITTNEIMNRTRHLNRKERAEILGALVEMGRIKMTEVKTNGRPRRVYVSNICVQ